ncbi:MAG: FecR domain-containing protein [Bacteriovoracaceae bacterium]|nr:FecR domain-containing protein [Bacteriovoracaceae bacterium]
MKNLNILLLTLLFSLSSFCQEIEVLFSKGSVLAIDEKSVERILSKGDLVEEGETLHTKANSFLILKIGQHSRHKIEPESIVRVDSLPYKFEGGQELEAPARIFIKYGTIVSEILQKSDNESAVITTGATSMGVRGTKFLVSLDEEDKDVYLSVNEGKVEIKNADQADIVEANQTIVVEKDRVFTAIQRYKFQKNIDWNMKEKQGLESFSSSRAQVRSELLKKRRKWKRDELRWQNFKETRAVKLERWHKKTEQLKPNKKLILKKRTEQRKELKKHRDEALNSIRKKQSSTPNNFLERKEHLKKRLIDQERNKRLLRERLKRKRDQLKQKEPDQSGTTDNK